MSKSVLSKTDQEAVRQWIRQLDTIANEIHGLITACGNKIEEAVEGGDLQNELTGTTELLQQAIEDYIDEAISNLKRVL